MTKTTNDQHDARKRSNARRRRATVQRRNGMSLEDYDAMLERQHGACAVCEHKFDRVLTLDCDPETGYVGGLLCDGCLERIGSLRHLWKHRAGCYGYLKRWGGEDYARAFMRRLFGRVPDDVTAQ
jgi:recombination endonuclease VII